MKVVIAAGGGGHFAPALSLIEKFPKDWSVVVFGRKYSFEGDTAVSLEYQACLARNIHFKSIITGRLQRVFTRHTIPSLFKIPVGFFQSLSLLIKGRPDVLLSFGGYISVPVGLAAFFLGIPVVIHEQSRKAGLANKFISLFAKKICISWESSLPFFPQNKTVLTGNPLYIKNNKNEKSVLPSSHSLPLLLILGGSSGSHAINSFIAPILEDLLQKYTVVLQTGDSKYKDYDYVMSSAKNFSEHLKNRLTITKFIDPGNISGLIEKSTLIVSRGGINTISLLLYFRKPSLIIPLPASQKNEQLDNGNFLKSVGLAEVYFQKNLDSEKLFQAILMMNDMIKSYALRENSIIVPKNPEEEIMKILKEVVS